MMFNTGVLIQVLLYSHLYYEQPLKHSFHCNTNGSDCTHCGNLLASSCCNNSLIGHTLSLNRERTLFQIYTNQTYSAFADGDSHQAMYYNTNISSNDLDPYTTHQSKSPRIGPIVMIFFNVKKPRQTRLTWIIHEDNRLIHTCGIASVS